MKPRFIRQDANKLKRLGMNWRKPKGVHSKLRNRFSGHRSNVTTGWKNSRTSRGLVNKLQNVLVYSIPEISAINPEKQGISIAGSVGFKKRSAIINKAQELGIKILNIRNVDDYIALHKAKREEKRKPHEAVKSADVTKEVEAVTESGEDKKEEQKKELDKLLTKRS